MWGPADAHTSQPALGWGSVRGSAGEDGQGVCSQGLLEKQAVSREQLLEWGEWGSALLASIPATGDWRAGRVQVPRIHRFAGPNSLDSPLGWSWAGRAPCWTEPRHCLGLQGVGTRSGLPKGLTAEPRAHLYRRPQIGQVTRSLPMSSQDLLRDAGQVLSLFGPPLAFPICSAGCRGP